jgi:hypothetical protein
MVAIKFVQTNTEKLRSAKEDDKESREPHYGEQLIKDQEPRSRKQRNNVFFESIHIRSWGMWSNILKIIFVYLRPEVLIYFHHYCVCGSIAQTSLSRLG